MTAPQDPFGSPSPGTPPPTAPYGQQPYGQQAYGQQPPFGTAPVRGMRNGLGVAALVLGILALLGGLFVVGGLLGLVAIGVGIAGRRRARRGEASNGGMALAGIVLGALGLLLSVAIAVGVSQLIDPEQIGDLSDCLAGAGDDRAAQEQCQRDFEDDLTGS